MVMASVYTKIMDNLAAVVRGKSDALRLLSITLLARGNVLMEDVPGVGKTTLAKTLARTIRGDFKRVQFTPDLLPTDILGCSVYNPKQGDFRFERGPVFTNILLADEINRASPRAQSALLEAMSEQQVTIEGNCYPLPRPFVVIATQNPVEFRGTYPLPEAQLDRFAVRLNLGYPEPSEERKILTSQKESHPLERLEPTVDLADVLEATEAVTRVAVEEPVVDYILALVERTRSDPRLRLGVSPRGSLALFRTSQALAFSQGRDYVTPDDVKELAVPVLAHRLLLDTKARYSGVSKEDIIREVVAGVEVPA
ncbi:MAG: MoxR family ATPase [Armatimonadetes bacterium]|nr:MoxR family ATPase [Armatimonadota bacterium]